MHMLAWQPYSNLSFSLQYSVLLGLIITFRAFGPFNWASPMFWFTITYSYLQAATYSDSDVTLLLIVKKNE